MMKSLLRLLGLVLLLGLVALAAFVLVPVKPTPPGETLAADWKPEPGRGEYVMRAADCVACHTADGGTPLAGGRAIASPLGIIRTANITPDKETGIGSWTLDQFRAALRDGLSADGRHLYPAMPYENFRLMSEGDIRALYEHLMNEVAPVSHRVEDTRLAFPFNLRFGLRAWNWLALRGEANFRPAGASALQDRGQYLIEGPGHCAACHSPRTRFMAQDGTRLGETGFLAGGFVDGWDVPPLRGPESASSKWSHEEISRYLATGRNAHSTANGAMALAIEHSLQYLKDADVYAMAAFLKGSDGVKGSGDGIDGDQPQALAGAPAAPPGPRVLAPAPADAAGAATAKLLTAASPDLPLGARLYLDNCAACHFVTGKGAPEIFPELQANSLVVAPEAGPLIGVILHGAQTPSTALRPMRLTMQGYAERLTDDEVAQLATFVRSAWGNQAAAVSATDVARLRAAPQGH